ncbi:MAG: serine/threonine-protein kinase [Gemmataceae bacterium]|nr:serine/threonine protein kinase [Gemmata sp.]MDW8197027.1 serine/threonine-protein kinase [Gemmataceae bacterium]
MPAPSTIPELLERLRKSRLIPPARLDSFLAGLPTASPQSPETVLAQLVAEGLLTPFHANKLAQGKYKGFLLGGERYLILDQLGSGGMGHVYLAEHIPMRRLVALKVLLPQIFENDAVARERFFREARAAGTLDHPNIVRVFDLCQDGKILFLVMEYVEGLSLNALVARQGPLPVTAACHYTRQVAFGLQHAHAMGFIHRDIKPANLLLDRSGLVKILDLGLVRSEAEADSGLTKQLENRRILGTADYVAPEQVIDSSQVDARADIYSLGATLYFLLTGRPLFPEGRAAQKLVWQQVRDPIPITQLRPEVPRQLGLVVHTMLQKRPADRYASAAEVFEALAPFDTDALPPPDPSWLPPLPARVAVARGLPTLAAPSTAGSTSQILVAAIRTGSGSSSSNMRRDQTPTPDWPKPGGLDSDAHGLRHTPPATRALEDDTPLDYHHRPLPPAPSLNPPVASRGPTVLLVTLSVALVLALAVIVMLLWLK